MLSTTTSELKNNLSVKILPLRSKKQENLRNSLVLLGVTSF